jgi:hypothetical protein
MTRYKRRATRHETMQELIAEVRALRAEVAYLSASRVQVVPMPYPVYPQPVPVQPSYNPLYPRYWNTTTIRGTASDLTIGSGVSDATTMIAYQSGD